MQCLKDFACLELYSKIEAGKLKLERAPFDMCDCIEDSLDLVSPQAASKGLELTCAICDTVVTFLVV